MLPARTYFRLARRVAQHWAGQRLPISVSWYLNAGCPNRCEGCFFFSRHFFQGEPLDTAQRFDLLEQLIAIRQPFITLLGGEPFLCPDLFPIAQRAREGGILVEVTTSGLDLSGADIDRIEGRFQRFWLSLDGPREAHDRRRGSGTWDRAMDTLRAVLDRRRSTRIGVSTVIDQHNVGTMAGFLRKLRAMGVDQVCIKDNLLPECRAGDAELARAIDELLRIKRETPGFIQQEEEFLRNLLDWRQNPHGACLLDSHLHISLLPDGMVSACVSFLVPIGNVRDRPLARILEPGPAERYAKAAECPGCTRNDYLLFLRFIRRPWEILAPDQFRKLLHT